MSQTKIPPYVTLAILALLAVSLFLSLSLNPTSDITWRLHVANSTLAGKEIYRDLIETNPPLWFWASLVWARVASVLHVSAYAVMCVGIHAIAGVAIFLLNRLTATTLNQWERCSLLLGFLVAFLFVTIGEIGQREQALLVGSVLWIALANRRLEGDVISPWLIISAALFGAYGFALKHFFVAIPIFIELWLFLCLKRAYRPVRLETLILGAAAVIYALAVIYLAPVFLSRIVPLVVVSYDSFGAAMGFFFQDRFIQIIVNSSFVLLPIAALVFARTRPRLAVGLLIFMTLAAIIMCAQFKGWRYHKLAAQGAAYMIVALALGGALGRGQHRDSREIRMALICLGVSTYLFIIAPLVSIVQNQGQPVSAQLKQLVLSEPRSKQIAILSVAPEHAFYLLDRSGRPQWSRHYSLWMLPGLQTPKAEPKAETIRVAEFNRVRREFIADLTCAPPDIMVSERGIMTVKMSIYIETLGYLKQDPAFALWFDNAYIKAEEFDIFTVWRLKGAKPNVGSCLRDL